MLDIMVVLDRSGSMQAAAADHIGGLRSFVADQKAAGDDAWFTLVQFDTHGPCEVVFDRVPIADVDESTITLIPRGGTPLLDAVGRSIAHLRAHQMREPASGTVVLIITDGEENASVEWTRDRVKSLLAEVEKQAGKVLYLGANVDAFAEAGSMGISATAAATYTNAPHLAGNAYAVTSQKLATLRSAVGAAAQARLHGSPTACFALMSDSLDYDAEDREAIVSPEPVDKAAVAARMADLKSRNVSK